MKIVDFKTSEAAANQSGAMGAGTISKHGRSSKSHKSRGNFSMSKRVFFMFLAIIGFGISTNAQNTVNLPENTQSRMDVIVTGKKLYNGFQTRITNIDGTHIHYVELRKNGTERVRKIDKRAVAFTLSFDENAKQEYYPVQMNVQEFVSLPTYRTKKGFVVFGTDNISNLSYINVIHPDISSAYVSGDTSGKIGVILIAASAPTLFLFLPFSVPGFILSSTGSNKINAAFRQYYSTLVDSEVLSKYGITVTPYNTYLTLKK